MEERRKGIQTSHTRRSYIFILTKRSNGKKSFVKYCNYKNIFGLKRFFLLNTSRHFNKRFAVVDVVVELLVKTKEVNFQQICRAKIFFSVQMFIYSVIPKKFSEKPQIKTLEFTA